MIAPHDDEEPKNVNETCKHVFIRVGTVLTLDGVATNHVVEV